MFILAYMTCNRVRNVLRYGVVTCKIKM
ncbi:hypothetical protein F383_11422 [Gossypium arboreum]|uniref:Uncharacterized protein n=1 Tax=Gossypium arboreum TaxID=29729 RepID=A0A0B0MF49_GOSAR|nr:hypothetical protein F383_11422 [Gossypium arboreum]